MVAYTYAGTPDFGGNGSLYLDGALVAHNTISQLSGNDYDVWIGGSPDYGTDRLFPGYITQAAFFTNALSATQIQILYQAGLLHPL